MRGATSAAALASLGLLWGAACGLPRAWAQEATAGPASSGGGSGSSALAAASADPEQVAAIARELNCPLCQGYNLHDCPLQVCAQMRQQIGRWLAEGQSPEAIRARFVADFGPQVLNRPPASGLGLLAWFGPPLALLGGFAALWLRRRLAMPRVPVGPAETGSRPPSPPAGDPAGDPARAEALDQRLAALLDEEA